MVIETLLEKNGNCRLPCWWGFVPGKTRWVDAYRILRPFIQIETDISPFDDSVLVASFLLRVSKRISETTLQHIYIIKNGIIEEMEVDPGEVPTYQVEKFLKSYGQPEEIYIRTYKTSYKGYLPFEVAFFYPSQGFVVMYAVNGSLAGDKVQGCLRRDSSPLIGIWSPERKLTFVDALKLVRQYFEDYQFLPVDVATGMDVEQFYQLAMSPNNCIRTPAKLWTEQF
jgi:hypothetical protein